MTGRLLCFGLGYSAALLAERLAGEGWTVVATVRTEEKRARLAGKGYDAYVFDRAHPLPAEAFAGVTHVLASIPPDAEGDPAAGVHGKDLAASESLVWAGLLSTTGVYGDRDGAWVDEDADLAATDERNLRRIAAENDWLSLHRDRGVPAHVFRLAGIYGPGRSPLDAIRAGKARRIVKPGLMLGRIHLEDIVGAVRASMARPRPGRVYNVTDDEPMPPQDIVAYGCALLGVAPPPEEDFATAEMTPLARSFYLGNKRVRNGRLRTELGYSLRYPDYRAGLDALLQEPPGQAWGH